MNRTPHSCIFGPVPSRRLGRSLGIDLVPFKTCTYDCIYCQLGRTTDRTLTRARFVDVDDVLRGTGAALDKKPGIDYLTLSGSGEPTLHTDIGEIITGLKREFAYPVAVLTNGSLFSDPDVACSLMEADVVMPTLAADSDTVFQCVHRPHPALHFDSVIRGIVDFAQKFNNRLWLEVFLLDGINTVEKNAQSLKAIIDEIQPQKIHLNTATRPPAEDYAHPAGMEKLESFAGSLGQRAEVVVDFNHNLNREPGGASGDIGNSILDLLKRRPCTLRDITAALSLHAIEVTKAIGHLAEEGRLKPQQQSGKLFYMIKPDTKGD